MPASTSSWLTRSVVLSATARAPSSGQEEVPRTTTSEPSTVARRRSTSALSRGARPSTARGGCRRSGSSRRVCPRWRKSLLANTRVCAPGLAQGLVGDVPAGAALEVEAQLRTASGWGQATSSSKATAADRSKVTALSHAKRSRSLEKGGGKGEAVWPWRPPARSGRKGFQAAAVAGAKSSTSRAAGGGGGQARRSRIRPCGNEFSTAVENLCEVGNEARETFSGTGVNPEPLNPEP